jgi:hypothetical protein
MNKGNKKVGTVVLKDELLNLSKGQGRRLCKIGAIVESLDDETAEALTAAMTSNASTMSITKALAANGNSIGRDVLAVKRECFKSPNDQCCISEKIKTLTNKKNK